MKRSSEQAENSIFYQQLDICCQKVAEQIGKKSIPDWTNGDYIRLSGLLSRKTSIHLSESTLKRIFGKSKYRRGIILKKQHAMPWQNL